MTTKEIAVKCGVTEQSIRNWCKKNNAPKAKQSANGKIAYLITHEVERKILEYYNIICDENHIMEIKLLSCLTKEERKLVKGLSIKKGYSLYKEGEKCSTIGIVVSGEIDIVSYSIEGKELIYNIIKILKL